MDGQAPLTVALYARTAHIHRTAHVAAKAAQTDADGIYVIVARLGDESAGETLRLRAARQTVTITARFDPENHTRERGTRVDFGGTKPVETPTAFTGTLKRFLSH